MNKGDSLAVPETVPLGSQTYSLIHKDAESCLERLDCTDVYREQVRDRPHLLDPRTGY